MSADREHRACRVIDLMVHLSGYDDLAAGRIREVIERVRSFIRRLPSEESGVAIARDLLDSLCLLDATYL